MALLALAAALSGCWTGRVYELGRLRESVVSYDRAALRKDRILLDYTVEIRGRDGVARERARRAVEIPRAALSARPEHAVDAFPLTRLEATDAARAGRPLVLWREPAPPPDGNGPFLALVPGEPGPAGFLLCQQELCEGRFHSEALYRDHTAWWVYALVPFSAALDAALFPGQAVSLAPFFLLGD